VLFEQTAATRRIGAIAPSGTSTFATKVPQAGESVFGLLGIERQHRAPGREVRSLDTFTTSCRRRSSCRHRARPSSLHSLPGRHVDVFVSEGSTAILAMCSDSLRPRLVQFSRVHRFVHTVADGDAVNGSTPRPCDPTTFGFLDRW